ncbi:MAG TPA: hypothetical protein VKX17_24910 [Planctomycetota bacterium]|nr:hypothetical protein [Planctomycetota bacterium]
MVYQSHVARQTDPAVYRRHFIGHAARLRRINEIDSRLSELVRILSDAERDYAWIEQTLKSINTSLPQAARLPELMESAVRAPFAQEQIDSCRRQLAGIDRNEIAALETEHAGVAESIKDREAALMAFSTAVGQLTERIKQLGIDFSGAQQSLRSAAEAFNELLASVDSEFQKSGLVVQPR